MHVMHTQLYKYIQKFVKWHYIKSARNAKNVNCKQLNASVKSSVSSLCLKTTVSYWVHQVEIKHE